MNMATEVNKSDVEEWLDQLDPNDPTVEVRDGTYLRRITEAMAAVSDADAQLHEAVAEARANGESWALIGMVLGVSKQAAQQRFS